MDNPPSTTEIPIRLLALNKACLLNLFEYLNFRDCVSLVQSCERRFDHIFRTIVHRKTFDDINSDYTLEEIRLIMDKYGSQLTKVATSSAVLFHSLSVHCSQGALRSLEFYNMMLDTEMIIRSTAVLRQLKSLSILMSSMTDDDLGILLASCPQLEELELDMYGPTGGYAQTPFTKITSNRLHRLTICCWTYFDRSTLCQLFAKCPNLRSLKMEVYFRESIPYDVITETLPNLGEINVVSIFPGSNSRMNSEGIGQLIFLKHLKSVYVCLRASHLDEFKSYLTSLGKHNTLEYLTIENEDNEDDCTDQLMGIIEAISSCQSLQTLRLLRLPAISKNLLIYADHLPRLRVLFVRVMGNMGAGDWNEENVLKLLEKCGKLRTLDLHSSHRSEITDAHFIEKLRKIVNDREHEDRKLAFSTDFLPSYEF